MCYFPLSYCNYFFILISLCIGILLGLYYTLNIRSVYFGVFKSIRLGFWGWALSSPPKPHAFASLPLQSSLLNTNGYFKYLKQFIYKLWINFLKYLFIILPFIILFKSMYHCWLHDIWIFSFFTQQLVSNFPFIGKFLMDSFWGDQHLLTLDDLENHKYIIETIFIGGLGGCLGRSLVEIFSTDLFKQPAGIGNYPFPVYPGEVRGDLVKIKGSNILKADNIKGLEWHKASDFHPISGSPEMSVAEMNAESLRRIIQSARDATYIYNIDCQEKLDKMKAWNSTPIGLITPDIYRAFGSIFKLGSQLTTRGLQSRMIWMGNMDRAMNFLSGVDSKEIQKIHNLLLDNINKYNSKLDELNDKLAEKGDILGFFNELFEQTNAFRNKNTSIVNKAEKIFQSSFNTSIYSKSPIFKELINKDYIEGKQKFNKEEQYLKTKVSEVLKEAKKNKK